MSADPQVKESRVDHGSVTVAVGHATEPQYDSGSAHQHSHNDPTITHLGVGRAAVARKVVREYRGSAAPLMYTIHQPKDERADDDGHGSQDQEDSTCTQVPSLGSFAGWPAPGAYSRSEECE